MATNQEAREFAEVCEQIFAMDQRVAAKQEELKQINARIWQDPQPLQTYTAPLTTYTPQQQYNAPQPPPLQQGGKFCPSCGSALGDTTKFCSNMA